MRREFSISRLNGTMAGVLLLIFTLYTINISLFSHTHIVDGAKIVHSHIYSAKHLLNEGSLSHSKEELLTIRVLSDYIAEEQSAIFIHFAEWTTPPTVYLERGVETTTGDVCRLPLLRAPPSTLIA